MATLISLREVVDALDAPNEDCESYLDPETGEVIMVTDEERHLVEDGSSQDLPEWQAEMLPKVRAALEVGRFLPLPDKFDIHEWSIMEEFSRAQTRRPIQQELLGAIRGAGAFRSFRSAIRRLGIEQSWYQFRAKALEEIARQWLEEHNLPYK